MLSPRPQQLPANFTAEKITSNAYTNAQIGYLYNVFTCCYADMYYKFVKSFKRGNNLTVATKQSIAQIKYMQMGLRVLRNWYNPSSTTVAATTTITTSTPYTYSAVAISIHLTPNPLLGIGSLSSLPLIAQVTGQTSFAAAFAALQPLLVSNGYNISVASATTSSQTVTYTAPSVYGNFTQYLYIQYTLTGASTPVTNFASQFSGGMDIFNPCITLQQIQKLIENMSKICGCFNCLNTAQILADNNYTPVGQLSAKPSGQVSLPVID